MATGQGCCGGGQHIQHGSITCCSIWISRYISIRQQYVSIRQHTQHIEHGSITCCSIWISRYISNTTAIRQHTSAYAAYTARQHNVLQYLDLETRQRTSAYVSIRQHYAVTLNITKPDKDAACVACGACGAGST
jgi:hypothetical protein